MFKIQLSGVKFYAYHGVHEEEKIIGGDYEVNVSVLYHPKAIPVRNVEEVIDYTSIYKIIKAKMDIPTPLLETLAIEISEDIFSAFLEAEEVIVEIKKINPPIAGLQGSVSVAYSMKRHTAGNIKFS